MGHGQSSLAGDWKSRLLKVLSKWSLTCSRAVLPLAKAVGLTSIGGWNVFSFVLCWQLFIYLLPSVLWRCRLGVRKDIRPVKKLEWWGAGMVICLEKGADLHVAQLMTPPLTVSCFSKIPIGFTFLVLAHWGSPRQRAVKRLCVYVCVSVCVVYLLRVHRWTPNFLLCRLPLLLFALGKR